MAKKDITIVLKNGLSSDVESTTVLPNEPVITTDTHKLFVGNEKGELIPVASEVQSVDSVFSTEFTNNIELTIELTSKELESFEDINGKYLDIAGKFIYVPDEISDDTRYGELESRVSVLEDILSSLLILDGGNSL